MTPEQEAGWKVKNAAWKKAWDEANREKRAAYSKAYNEANREKLAAKYKAYREANREKVAAYREANREKVSARDKATIENLALSYVSQRLNMKPSEVTPELLELKREQLRLSRLTRELKKESQNV